MIKLILISILGTSGVVDTKKSPATHAAMLSPVQATEARLSTLKKSGYSAVLLDLSEATRPLASAAAKRVTAAKLKLGYWVEIARCPALADAHPQWMASLQGHPEWRRHFPGFPEPGAGEVVKNYPWVPILYKESFDAHLVRLDNLLGGLPKASLLMLNDLQAAPSACGCGNTLCRWTPDYGPIKTATRLGPDAAARFVAEAKRRTKIAEIVPVWTTECQEHESAKGGHCDGVPCFNGACWIDFTAQLKPLARTVQRIGVLTTHRELAQLEEAGKPDGQWVRDVLTSMLTMPPKRGGDGIEMHRLVPVLQGWGTMPTQMQAQRARAEESGARLIVTALSTIYQGWSPRIVRAEQIPERQASKK